MNANHAQPRPYIRAHPQPITSVGQFEHQEEMRLIIPFLTILEGSDMLTFVVIFKGRVSNGLKSHSELFINKTTTLKKIT